MTKAIVLINVDSGAERDTVARIKRVPNVIEAHVVYGGYDIVSLIEAESPAKVKETVSENLRTIENIQSTLTMMVIGN